MPLILSQRQPGLVENMDREDCDLQLLENTYSQFHRINALLSQWKRIYRQYIRPQLKENGINTILDIGFGGGDIPLQLHKWIKKDGFEAKITAIETDLRSYEYASSLKAPSDIQFRHISTTKLLKEGKQYDFVLSNHLLHHISEEDLPALLDEAVALCRHKVLFNDIQRSDLGYAAFNVFARLLFSNSFITEDGLISIKKSYTPDELRKLTGPEWKVHKLFPYRILLEYEKS